MREMKKRCKKQMTFRPKFNMYAFQLDSWFPLKFSLLCTDCPPAVKWILYSLSLNIPEEVFGFEWFSFRKSVAFLPQIVIIYDIVIQRVDLHSFQYVVIVWVIFYKTLYPIFYLNMSNFHKCWINITYGYLCYIIRLLLSVVWVNGIYFFVGENTGEC